MPTDTYITLPSDSGNLGKKTAAQQRTQGADSVYLQKFIEERAGVVTEVFRIATITVTQMAVSAQNGTTTGLLWLMNPASSTRTIRIRRISLQYNFIGVTTLTTLPRMVAQRFTWTGDASGASVAAAAVWSSADVTQADIRTAMTGLTISLLTPIVCSDLPPMGQVAGTAAVFETTATVRSEMIDADNAEDEWIVLTPGQGLVLYQADAGGATTETRRVLPTIVYDEVNASG